MTRRDPDERGPGGHAEPPRRDPGWVVLLALTACGIVASFLATGPKGDPVPPSPPPTASATSGEANADGPAPSPSSGSAAPSAPAVKAAGNGRIVPVRTSGKDTGRTGRVVRWTVEAEQGLGIDLAELADVVGETLRDERGWEPEIDVHFVRVPAWRAEQGAPVDVRVTLASPTTTDRLCAPMRTGGEVSCWNDGRAILNSRRWMLGAPSYGTDLDAYRTYLVNHEVGHGLGYGHEPCHGKGERASVMLQQTLGLDGCTAHPYPKGDGSTWR